MVNANIIPTNKLGEMLARNGMSDAAIAMIEDLAASEAKADALDGKNIKDFLGEIGLAVGKKVDQTAAYGIGGAVLEGIISHADQIALHKGVIELMEDNVPGMLTVTFEHEGKEYEIHVDATGTAFGEDEAKMYENAPDSRRDRTSRLGAREYVPPEVMRAHMNAAESQAIGQVQDYIAEHGQEAYEELLENATENKAIAREYEVENRVDLNAEAPDQPIKSAISAAIPIIVNNAM